MNCSSSAHTWDAFQLAYASFRMYCSGNCLVFPESSHKEVSEDLGPHLLGERLKINVEPLALEKEVDDDEESSLEIPSVSVLDNDVEMRFLVCGEPGSLVSRTRCILLIFYAKFHSVKCMNVQTSILLMSYMA